MNKILNKNFALCAMRAARKGSPTAQFYFRIILKMGMRNQGIDIPIEEIGMSLKEMENMAEQLKVRNSFSEKVKRQFRKIFKW